jgi:hypothetical protein
VLTIPRLACALAHTLGYRAAPGVHGHELAEILAELPAGPLPAPSFPESVLWTRLKQEIGFEPHDLSSATLSGTSLAIN